jgi:hypothetical protein
MFNLEFLGVSPSKNMNFGKIRSETPVTRISPTMTKGFNGSSMDDGCDFWIW